MSKLLLDLLNAYGPSGREQQVRAIIHKQIKKHVDEIKVDKFGNLIARKKGKGPKVMLASHMDEIGLMVKGISEEGHIHFAAVGGIEPITLAGQSVCILGKTNVCLAQGIITCKAMQDDYALDEIPEFHEFYVDIGLDKKGVEKIGITIGDYIVAKHEATTLGAKDIVSGKAIDNRAGCYILIETLKQIKKAPYDLYFVFTVQEEIGLYGAKFATYQIDPDWAIAVDTTNTEDAHDKNPGVALGKGPILVHMDAEVISNTCLNQWITQAAKKANIKLQHKVEEEGATDAASMMASKAGVPSTSFSIGVRNLHSTVSVASIKDMHQATKVLLKLLSTKQTKCLV